MKCQIQKSNFCNNNLFTPVTNSTQLLSLLNKRQYISTITVKSRKRNLKIYRKRRKKNPKGCGKDAIMKANH